MRKLLQYLFPIAALTLALMGSSRADAPQLAVCKDGQCVMSEADYKHLQDFAARLREYAQSSQANDDERDRIVTSTMKALESCRARIERLHA